MYSALWRVTLSAYTPRPAHVNLQELREVILELQSRSTRYLLPSRCVNAVDSRVALRAWARGRSSSLAINGMMRKSIGLEILGQKTMDNIWVCSKYNLADDLSRFAPVREPKETPQWLEPHHQLQDKSLPRRAKVNFEWARVYYASANQMSTALDLGGYHVVEPLSCDPQPHKLRDLDLRERSVRISNLEEAYAGVYTACIFSLQNILAKLPASEHDEHIWFCCRMIHGIHTLQRGRGILILPHAHATHSHPAYLWLCSRISCMKRKLISACMVFGYRVAPVTATAASAPW